MTFETLWIFLGSFQFIIGSIGNFLVFYISSRPKFRCVTIFRYLIVAMINDFFISITGWFYAVPNFFKANENLYSCKITQYFGYLFFQYGPWIIVLASLDRLASVKYPTKFQFRNDLKYQALALSVIFIILSLLNVLLCYFYDIEYLGYQFESINTTQCNTRDVNIQFYLDIYDCLIAAVIPFTIMITTTVIIARIFVKKKQHFKMIQNLKKIPNS